MVVRLGQFPGVLVSCAYPCMVMYDSTTGTVPRMDRKRRNNFFVTGTYASLLIVEAGKLLLDCHH